MFSYSWRNFKWGLSDKLCLVECCTGVGRDWKQVLDKSVKEDVVGLCVGVARPGDHGVFTDVKTKAWHIYFHIYPLTTQTPEQDVDNANILTNTQFMLSAPWIMIPRQRDPLVPGFYSSRQIEPCTIFMRQYFLLFQNSVWNSRFIHKKKKMYLNFDFVFSLMSRGIFIPEVSPG